MHQLKQFEPDVGIDLGNPHPGEIMSLEFLKPLGISQYRLAKATHLTQSHISELVKGKRNFTADSAVRIGAALGTTANIWINLQAQYDIREAQRKQAKDNIQVTRLVPARTETEKELQPA